MNMFFGLTTKTFIAACHACVSRMRVTHACHAACLACVSRLRRLRALATYPGCVSRSVSRMRVPVTYPCCVPKSRTGPGARLMATVLTMKQSYGTPGRVKMRPAPKSLGPGSYGTSGRVKMRPVAKSLSPEHWPRWPD